MKMKKCDIKVIYGGPKIKYYCEICNKLFDVPNPPCENK